jgi:thiol-disulfide isomerase/thioredoxin
MVKLDNITLALIVGGAILVGLFIYWFFLTPTQSGETQQTQGASAQAASHPPSQPQPAPQQPQKSQGPVLVLFYGDHCPHCHAMMPAWGEVRQALGDKLVIKEIESQNPESANYIPPRGVPTIRLYQHGVEDRSGFVDYSGDRSAQSIINFVMSGAQQPRRPN